MDFQEMSNAIRRANTISHRIYASREPVEVDYAIVKLSPENYVVARSNKLGSLDYQFVCECDSHPEAHAIVEALSR
jgi:hypothetical protein